MLGSEFLLPADIQEQHPTAAHLEIFTTKTTTDEVYHRCTDFLATTVLQTGEAIMAQNAIATPLSPRIKTVERLGAARTISWLTFSMPLLTPTISLSAPSILIISPVAPGPR